MYRDDLDFLVMETLSARRADEHADDTAREERIAEENSPSAVLGEMAFVLIMALTLAAVAQIALGHVTP